MVVDCLPERWIGAHVEAWIRMLRSADIDHSEVGLERMRQCVTMQWNAGKRDFESAAIGCRAVDD
jgi:hypothetical protein